MSEFKVGDEVVIKNSNGSPLQPKTKGVISKVAETRDEDIYTVGGEVEGTWLFLEDHLTKAHANPVEYPDDNPKALAGSLKVPLQLVPPVLMIEVAKVMQHGADKYGAFNFRESKIAATVYVGAILRHCLAIADGQDIDPESGESHWAHIAASCGIALDAQACGTFVDDRAKGGTAFQEPLTIEQTGEM